MLHSPYSVCHHSNTAEGQLDKKQLISWVSDNTQLGPLLSNWTSQNFLKTEPVKAKKWPSPWWSCSVHLQSATAGPLIPYICTVTLCWVFKVIVMSSEPQVVLHFHKVLLSTRYSPAIITEFITEYPQLHTITSLKSYFSVSIWFPPSLISPKSKNIYISQKTNYPCLTWLNIYFCNFSPYCRNRQSWQTAELAQTAVWARQSGHLYYPVT